MSGLTGALAGITESVILPAVVADALEEHGHDHDAEQEETA